MPSTTSLLAFALVCFTMASTPGPNMIYLVSRSICQGPTAGLVSLVGVAAAFVVYMTCSALGLTALLMAVPFAYDTIRIAGAAYLFWMAWQAVRPAGRSPFKVHRLESDPPAKLMLMGFATNMLNPKAAVLYLSLLPQFMQPSEGHLLLQALSLGVVQIAISFAVNTVIILTAGKLATFLQHNPRWERVQRWAMGTILAGLAVRMLAEGRRA